MRKPIFSKRAARPGEASPRARPMKGIKTGTGLGLLGFFIVAAAVVIVVMYHPPNVVNNYTGAGGGQQLPVPPNSTSTCSSNNACKLQLYAYITNLNSSVGAPTQLAVPYQLFAAGSALATASGTTSAIAATNVSGVNYGGQYTAFFGNDVSEYVAAVNVTVRQTVQSVAKQLLPISVPTMDFNNNTVAGFSAKGGVLTGVANNYVDSALTQRIKTSYGYYGDPNALLIYAYNSSQISSITLPSGFVATTVPQGLVSVPAGDAVAGFSMSQLPPNFIDSFTPTIKTGTLPANTLIPSTIHTWVASQGAQQVNGQLESGLYINATKVNSPLVTVSGEYNISVYG